MSTDDLFNVVVVVVGFSSSCWMMEQTCSLSIHLILIQYISSNECSSVVYGACLLPFKTLSGSLAACHLSQSFKVGYADTILFVRTNCWNEVASSVQVGALMVQLLDREFL